MKVLMTTDAVGGVWTYAMQLARGISERGGSVVLATMGPRPSPDQRAEAREIPGLVLEESAHRLEWMQHPWEDVGQAGRWLLALEREHAPDIVHLNGYAHAALPWRAPVLLAAHSCVAGWWHAVYGAELPREWARYRKAVTVGLAGADLVVAPTQAMLDSLQRFYGKFPTPTRVIPNGQDPVRFAPGAKEPVVLATGRLWDRAKDMGTLDAAAEGLAWPVHIVGPTKSPQGDLAPEMRHARLEGRVDAEKLRARYGRASIYAHAARYEPFGLGPLEAALSGCALVLSDIATLREIWGDAADYAPVGDPAAFRAAIGALIDDPRRLAEQAERARAVALTLTTARMADAYVDAYARLRQARDAARAKEASHCAS